MNLNKQRIWWILLFIWLVLAVTSIVRINTFYNIKDIGFWDVVLVNIMRWGFVIPFLFLFYGLTKRFSLTENRFFIPLHFVFILLLAPVISAVYTLPTYLYYSDMVLTADSFLLSVKDNLRWNILTVPLLYVLTAGYYYYIKNYEDFVSEQLRSEQLKKDLLEAKLSIFRSQLDPHFLFNTLQSILVLIDEKSLKARETLTYLTRILTILKKRKDELKVELDEEMELVNYYLKIEKIRYQENLRIVQHIDPEARPALIPTLSIQPLVENAVRHGIAKCSEAGYVKINARTDRERGQLHISVENSDSNLAVEDVFGNSNGIGISNIKSRLNRMYTVSEFRITKSKLGGLKVRYSIPLEINQTEGDYEEDKICYSR